MGIKRFFIFWILLFPPLAFTSELHKIVSKGDANQVSELLQKNKNIDINALNDDKKSALYLAVEAGNYKIVELLIEAGARVNLFYHKYNNYVLTLAALNEDEKMIGLLLQNGADPNLKNYEGNTVLMKASSKVNANILDRMIKSGADINIQNIYGQSLLLYAFLYHDWEAKDLKFFIEHGADIAIKDHKGYNLLSYAVWSCKKELLMNALKYVEKNTEILSLQNAAACAIEKNDYDYLNTLLEIGLNVNGGQRYSSLLFFAVESHNLKMLKYLIQKGANLDSLNFSQETALYDSLNKGLPEFASFLIKSKTDVNIANLYGETPILLAVRKQYYEIIKSMISSGADIHMPDMNGNTPILTAVQLQNKQIVELLLKAGANIYAKDNNGFSALDYANKKPNAEILQLLKSFERL